jgi:hypothetical protein
MCCSSVEYNNKFISKEKSFTLPPVYVHFKSGKSDERFCGPKVISVDRVELEESFGNIIPDIVNDEVCRLVMLI